MSSHINQLSDLTLKLDLLDLDAEFDRIVVESGVLDSEPLFEESTLIKQFGESPEGQALARFLHQTHKISNRASIRKHNMKQSNFSAQYKEHFDNLLIVECQKGWGAAIPNMQYMKSMWKFDRETDQATDGYKAPKDDRGLPFDIYYAITNSDGTVSVKHESRERMGALRTKDPRNPHNVLNLMEERLGTIRQLWFADQRDDPAVKSLPPEQLAGRRSRELGEPGASVERTKIYARRPGEETTGKMALPPGTTPEFAAITKKIMLLAPQMLRNIRKVLRRSGAEDTVLDHLDDVISDPAAIKSQVVYALAFFFRWNPASMKKMLTGTPEEKSTETKAAIDSVRSSLTIHFS